MKKALITGSETFGKYLTNPTKWLALFADGKVIAGYEIHSLIFPSIVSVSEGQDNPGEIIVKKAHEIRADIIISFGMASEIKGFRIERTGTNWVYNEKYLSKLENNKLLDLSRTEKEKVQIDLSLWDIEKMQALFARAGIPLEGKISDELGYYSCNSWIYRTLIAMSVKQTKIPYLFIHCSCTEEAVELMPEFDRKNKTIIKREDLLKALEIILQSRT